MKQYIISKFAWVFNAFEKMIRFFGGCLSAILAAKVYCGRNIADLPAGSIVFFPYRENIFCCGIAALVSYKHKKTTAPPQKTSSLDEMVSQIRGQGCGNRKANDFGDIDDHYLGGEDLIKSLWQAVQRLKCQDHFFALYTDSDDQIRLENICNRLSLYWMDYEKKS